MLVGKKLWLYIYFFLSLTFHFWIFLTPENFIQNELNLWIDSNLTLSVKVGTKISKDYLTHFHNTIKIVKHDNCLKIRINIYHANRPSKPIKEFNLCWPQMTFWPLQKTIALFEFLLYVQHLWQYVCTNGTSWPLVYIPDSTEAQNSSWIHKKTLKMNAKKWPRSCSIERLNASAGGMLVEGWTTGSVIWLSLFYSKGYFVMSSNERSSNWEQDL